jgi:cyclic-di-GMP-binding protein
VPSFDVVIEPDLVELRNAVEQANKEIGTRFDFKGTSAQVEVASPGAKQREITIFGDSDFQLEQVRELLLTRLAKRGVDLRFLDFEAPPQKIGGDRLRWPVAVKSGIDAEMARQVSNTLKTRKLRVQAAFQGDIVRVSGAKRDDLQAAIALLRRELVQWPLSFENFRN